jgi:hypothetical protein
VMVLSDLGMGSREAASSGLSAMRVLVSNCTGER